MSTNTEECDSISKDLGKNNSMILRNHGLLTAGTNYWRSIYANVLS